MTRTLIITTLFAVMLIIALTVTCDSYNGVDWIYLLPSVCGYTVLAVSGRLRERFYATCYIFALHLLLSHSLTNAYATKAVKSIQRAWQCAAGTTNILNETMLLAPRTAPQTVSQSIYTRAVGQYAPTHANVFVWTGILCAAFFLLVAFTRDHVLARAAFAFCSFASLWIAILAEQFLFSTWDIHVRGVISCFF